MDASAVDVSVGDGQWTPNGQLFFAFSSAAAFSHGGFLLQEERSVSMSLEGAVGDYAGLGNQQ